MALPFHRFMETVYSRNRVVTALIRLMIVSMSVDDRNVRRMAMRLPMSTIFLRLVTQSNGVVMPKTMTLNVRVNGALGEFVASKIGDNGAYENVSEYVRDLIRRDKERAETEGFERLKAELTAAFAAPESTYGVLDAETVIARNARH
jgi:Arc/MetJ-type ribon-helix-helix transcriptional regulator